MLGCCSPFNIPASSLKRCLSVFDSLRSCRGQKGEYLDFTHHIQQMYTDLFRIRTISKNTLMTKTVNSPDIWRFVVLFATCISFNTQNFTYGSGTSTHTVEGIGMWPHFLWLTTVNQMECVQLCPRFKKTTLKVTT